MEEYIRILIVGLKLTAYVVLAAAHLIALILIIYYTISGMLFLGYKALRK